MYVVLVTANKNSPMTLNNIIEINIQLVGSRLNLSYFTLRGIEYELNLDMNHVTGSQIHVTMQQKYMRGPTSDVS